MTSLSVGLVHVLRLGCRVVLSSHSGSGGVVTAVLSVAITALVLLRLTGGESRIAGCRTESTSGPLFLRVGFLLLVPTSLLSVSSAVVVLVRISLLVRCVVR